MPAKAASTPPRGSRPDNLLAAGGFTRPWEGPGVLKAAATAAAAGRLAPKVRESAGQSVCAFTWAATAYWSNSRGCNRLPSAARPSWNEWRRRVAARRSESSLTEQSVPTGGNEDICSGLQVRSWTGKQTTVWTRALLVTDHCLDQSSTSNKPLSGPELYW